jgi:hypothetical protein
VAQGWQQLPRPWPQAGAVVGLLGNPRGRHLTPVASPTRPAITQCHVGKVASAHLIGVPPLPKTFVCEWTSQVNPPCARGVPQSLRHRDNLGHQYKAVSSPRSC